jgi:hypothetical protein
MGQDTYGYDNDQDQPEAYLDQPEAYRGQPEAYWRRRVITLCAGLALLAVLAWAFSGGGKAPSAARKPSQASSALPAAAYSSSPSSSPGASGSASAPAGSAASLPFPAVTSGSGQAKSAAPSKKSAIRSAAAGAGAGAGAGNAPPGGRSGVEPDGSCAPGSVVLSLFTSRTSYYAGQYPAFQIYAVSTASRVCSFDASPHRLHVQVTSSGRVIWDSADCTKGEPNRVVRLRRGVPTEASVTWRRNISLPGCVTVASSAHRGGYQVQAKDASVASPVRSFKLAR